MLGQFFSRKAAGAPSPTATLDSVTDESHTRHLLYPDAHSLYHADGHAHPLPAFGPGLGHGHDGPLPEIDLEHPRDCRIIIAQDEFLSTPKAILYDSKPAAPRAESPTPAHSQPRARNFFGGGHAPHAHTAGPALGGIHARRSSLVPEPSAPASPTVAAFARVRTRGNSISSMPHIDEHAQAQQQHHVYQQQQQRGAPSPPPPKGTESLDVVRTCLDCMFGNTAMSYRGNSNKLHILPLESRPADPGPPPPSLHDGPGSLGRVDGFRRRSHLAKSFTAANIPPELPSPAAHDARSRTPLRRTIFVTRVFSVAAPDEERDPAPPQPQSQTPTPQSSLGKGNGFPFPRTASKGASSKPAPLQSRKTPMYAITIILDLPVATTSLTAQRPATHAGHHARATSQTSTSIPGHDSLGSSLESDRRAGWAALDPTFGVDSFMSLNSDVDDRVDVIGQHWDVIARTLTSLQHVVQQRISAHFKDSAKVPSVLQPPRNQPSRYASKEPTFQPARRGFRLQPNELAFDKEIRDAVQHAGIRVVSGMRIPRVATGQGKWGIWREEARWLGRWAGRREENFFFFNLLTAFLGNHTEWLNLLGPKWHRKRHREQQRSNAGENLNIPNRTVVISPDKMAARRLIFLLAAFLPATATAAYDGASPMRPSTSASLRGYSQSPPTNMPPSRKHSLRRQINRRPRGKQSLTNITSQGSGGAGLASLEPADVRTDSGVAEFHEPSRHARHSSAHLVQQNLLLPSMSDTVPTQSGAVSLSPDSSQAAVPVALFTLPRKKSSSTAREERPESSGSLASTNLINTLQRSNTGHASHHSTDSGSTSRWSVFTSFWNGGRRQSSTDQSEYLQTTDDGLGMSHAGYRTLERPRSQLEQMVQGLSMDKELFDDSDAFDLAADLMPSADPETGIEGYSLSPSGVPASAARPIPERPKRYDTALKLSVNEKDGVIDVDIPLPDFGSPLQSPLFGGCASASSQQGSSYGESSILSMPHIEPDQPVNAAGWLKQFHPDFAIQALKPYPDIERDVKKAMSAEPTPITSAATPTLESGPLERWVDVCSALIADTRTFSIKRLRLRRLVKLIPTPTVQGSALTPGISGMPGNSKYGNPYTSGGVGPLMTEVHLDEKFIEEAIMDFDAILIDAVDRVLAQSGSVGTSRVHSAASSRSSSRRGRTGARDGIAGDLLASTQPGMHQSQHQQTSQQPSQSQPLDLTESQSQSQMQFHIQAPPPDCKTIIFDALESVVKNVTAERSREGAAMIAGSGTMNKTAEVAARSVRTANDSSLREGVRRWLCEVE